MICRGIHLDSVGPALPAHADGTWSCAVRRPPQRPSDEYYSTSCRRTGCLSRRFVARDCDLSHEFRPFVARDCDLSHEITICRTSFSLLSHEIAICRTRFGNSCDKDPCQGLEFDFHPMKTGLNSCDRRFVARMSHLPETISPATDRCGHSSCRGVSRQAFDGGCKGT